MKKWIVLFSVIVTIICLAWVMYVKLPLSISVDIELPGVKYQLGSEAVTEPATVVIQGKLYTSLNGERVFNGVVQFIGEQIPVPQDQRKVEIRFSKDGWGSIVYPYFIYDESGAVKDSNIYQSHSIFTNKDFSQVTLLLTTPDQQSDPETPQSIWNSENGMMISAPASSREEALALSNKLMHEFLKGEALH